MNNEQMLVRAFYGLGKYDDNIDALMDEAMMELCGCASRYASVRIVDVERDEGDDWSSRTFTLYVPDGQFCATSEELLESFYFAGLVQRQRHCTHSYDCCGHWYPRTPRIERIDANTVKLRQDWICNV